MRVAALAVLLLLAACSGGTTQPTDEPPGDGGQQPVSTSGPVTVPGTPPQSTSTTAGASATTEGSTTSTSSTTTTTLLPLTALTLEDVADLGSPIEAVVAGGNLFVASKDGRVWLIDGEPELALDISGPVRNRGEQGLLGFAVHPNHPEDPRVFAYFIDQAGESVLASYEFAESGTEIDPDSVQILLRIPQPATNHNGGKIAFGPDGYLYVGLGDGGRRNDAFGNGQNRNSLLGGILRLDVSAAERYSIPADNPFQDDGADELWAIGLRNPWRFTFDGGLMYIADVGQNAFEEIDVVPVVSAGYNFGWPITEGLHCFRPASGCEVDGLTLPVVEVAHTDSGTCSITGGVVYRGTMIPELAGHYLYSDYCAGYLRSFVVDDGVVTAQSDWTEQTGSLGQVVAFAHDVDGEVLVMTADGMVRRLVAIRG